MGGLLKECGCFDGPFSESDPTFVSIRCDDHLDVPGEGLMMRRSQAGVAALVNIRNEFPRMAIPKGRRVRPR